MLWRGAFSGVGAFLWSCGAALHAQSGRYWDSLFSWRVQTVEYGQAPTVFGGNQTLRADFFLPENDTETRRPVVVLLFGGAYVSGSRQDADITHIARYFAKRGYVAVTIDYRTGIALPTTTEWAKAAIRAVHDLKAFIRFLKKSVAVEGNPYGIDTSRIYVGGSSAGAFTALHAAYVSSLAELAEAPEVDTAYVSSQGGLEGNSGNPGYSSRFAAAFSLSGGMLRASWIEPTDVPAVVCMHGTGDATVPYRSGTVPFIPVQVDGGYVVDSVAGVRGLYHALFTWQGAGHVPYGTQTSVNPTYMADVEQFLRYHFYQWNSRFASGVAAAEGPPSEAGPWSVWSVEGRYWGEVTEPGALPPGLWLLRNASGVTRRVLRLAE